MSEAGPTSSFRRLLTDSAVAWILFSSQGCIIHSNRGRQKSGYSSYGTVMLKATINLREQGWTRGQRGHPGAQSDWQNQLTCQSWSHINQYNVFFLVLFFSLSQMTRTASKNQLQSQSKTQLSFPGSPFAFQKCTAPVAPLVVPLQTPWTGNSISLNKRCSSRRPRTWSTPHGFPPVALCDSNAHIFTVINANNCCVPHLPRPYQYQFSTMKLP